MSATTHTRTVFAAFGLVAAAIALTGAALFTSAEQRVLLDGTDNRFALVSAASLEPGWAPTAADWRTASVEPIALTLAPADRDRIESGAPVEIGLAVRNSAPLSGSLSLHITRPESMSESVFAALRFTVIDGTSTMLLETAGDRLPVLHWPDSFDRDDIKQVKVGVSAPADFELGDHVPLVNLRFEGVNR